MSFQETARRRTFAIISHPDAGKTTITEKLLLFGGPLAALISHRQGLNDDLALQNLGAGDDETSGLSNFT